MLMSAAAEIYMTVIIRLNVTTFLDHSGVHVQRDTEIPGLVILIEVGGNVRLAPLNIVAVTGNADMKEGSLSASKFTYLYK